MADATGVPGYVRAANMLMANLLRAGIKIRGFGYPAYLLTVRGRKSGLPRTTPIVIIEQEGKRYLVSPFGLVDWVRNLRAAGEAVLTRGHRTEMVRAVELTSYEAGRVLKKGLQHGIPPFLGKRFELTADSSQEEIERVVVTHPVFLLESVT